MFLRKYSLIPNMCSIHWKWLLFYPGVHNAVYAVWKGWGLHQCVTRRSQTVCASFLIPQKKETHTHIKPGRCSIPPSTNTHLAVLLAASGFQPYIMSVLKFQHFWIFYASPQLLYSYNCWAGSIDFISVFCIFIILCLCFAFFPIVFSKASSCML